MSYKIYSKPIFMEDEGREQFLATVNSEEEAEAWIQKYTEDLKKKYNFTMYESDFAVYHEV